MTLVSPIKEIKEALVEATTTYAIPTLCALTAFGVGYYVHKNTTKTKQLLYSALYAVTFGALAYGIGQRVAPIVAPVK
jgi:hypothetical protein